MSESWGLDNADGQQRDGQKHVIKSFIQWLNGGCNGGTFSVFMCCRYGKSDAIRNLSVLALENNKACASLVVHPSPVLAEQLLDNSRLIGWRQRWLPHGPAIAKVQTLPDFAYKSMCNNEWIGSIHIHALMQSQQSLLLMKWVQRCKDLTGMLPIIFFDEAHQFSKSNKWGDVARKLHAAGCLVVVLTATPFRNDEDDIFGFKKRLVSKPVSNQIRYVQPHSQDHCKLELHTVTRDETEYAIEADVEVSFAQGWAEGAIAKCSLDLIDWNMEGYGNWAGEEKLLSEIPQKPARSVLHSLYRDPAIIRHAAKIVVERLVEMRKKVPDATVIWYGMNDDEEASGASDNPKAIRDAIKAVSPGMSVGIATLATDDEADEKSKETIKRFCDEKKKGHDFLVLKQMGGGGLDSDRVCIVVLWNTVRSLDKMIQMLMRGGNVSQSKTHFFVVGLKDSITKSKLKSFIDGEGGNYIDAVETDHEFELIDKKDNVDGGYIAVDAADSGMSDSDGKVCTFEETRLAFYISSEFGGLLNTFTVPQLAEKGIGLRISLPDVPVEVSFTDTTEACKEYRRGLGDWVKKIGRVMFRSRNKRSGGVDDGKAFGEIYREVAGLIKKKSGVFGSWDANAKDRSQNTSDYRKWYAAASSLLEEVSREKSASNS